MPDTAGTDDGDGDGGERGECSLLTNTDCGPHSKCSVELQLATDTIPECVPVRGDALPGTRCAPDEVVPATDECAPGSMCLTDFHERAGRCAAFCGPGRTCPGAEQLCVSVWGKDVPLCVEECNPLDHDCPDDWICHEGVGLQRWYCAPPLDGERGGHGSACTRNGLELCGPGFACLGRLSVGSDACLAEHRDLGCCAALCELGEDTACPSQLELCMPLYPAPQPGLEHVGVCAIPYVFER